MPTYDHDYYSEGRKKKMNAGRTILIVIASIIILVALTCLCCCRTVPTGYTGILTTFGKVEDNTVSAGAHFIAPWQKIVKLDNRTQKVMITTQAFSSDIQQVDIQMSVNFVIDQSTAQELYKTVGANYYDNVVYPRILENTKAIFAKYSAEDLVNNREKLSTEILDILADDVEVYGIKMVSLSVEDIDFTDEFTNAVEQKQVAYQNKLTAQTKQDQLTMEQKAIAERQVIDAQAAADVAKIQAEADLEVTKIQADAAEYAGQKEAAKNKAISEWLSQDLIKYYLIQQWDGKLPNYSLGGNSNVLFGLSE